MDKLAGVSGEPPPPEVRYIRITTSKIASQRYLARRLMVKRNNLPPIPWSLRCLGISFPPILKLLGVHHAVPEHYLAYPLLCG